MLSIPLRAILKQSQWSIAIGIYSGTDPLALASPRDLTNPVLTAADVTDAPAVYVADPFMAPYDGGWVMLFEVLNARTGRGEIALATSRDGRDWEYQRVVLAEPFHLAYPHLFRWQDRHYMIPETCSNRSVRLYEATAFPGEWRFVTELLNDGHLYSDASIVRHDGRLWLFVLRGWTDLALFFSDSLTSGWVEHPASPVVSNNPHVTRPSGRMLKRDNEIVRFAQDGVPVYGSRVRAFAISKLTPTEYLERPVGPDPILAGSGRGWNRDGMHHVDLHQTGPEQWMACVDGLRKLRVLGQVLQFSRAVGSLLVDRRLTARR